MKTIVQIFVLSIVILSISSIRRSWADDALDKVYQPTFKSFADYESRALGTGVKMKLITARNGPDDIYLEIKSLQARYLKSDTELQKARDEFFEKTKLLNSLKARVGGASRSKETDKQIEVLLNSVAKAATAYEAAIAGRVKVTESMDASNYSNHFKQDLTKFDSPQTDPDRASQANFKQQLASWKSSIAGTGPAGTNLVASMQDQGLNTKVSYAAWLTFMEEGTKEGIKFYEDALAISHIHDPDMVEMFKDWLEESHVVLREITDMRSNWFFQRLSNGSFTSSEAEVIAKSTLKIATVRDDIQLIRKRLAPENSLVCKTPEPVDPVQVQLDRIEGAATNRPLSRVDELLIIRAMTGDFLAGNDALRNYILRTEKENKFGSMVVAMNVWRKGIVFIERIPEADRSPELRKSLIEVKAFLTEKEASLNQTEAGGIALDRINPLFQSPVNFCPPEPSK